MIIGEERRDNSNFSDLLIFGGVRAAKASVSIRTGDKKSVDSGERAREVVVIKINIPGVCESSEPNGDGKVRGVPRGEKAAEGHDVVPNSYVP